MKTESVFELWVITDRNNGDYKFDNGWKLKR